MKLLTLVLAILIASTLGHSNVNAQTLNTFQISNQQADPLGTVTVTSPGGNYYVSVAGIETDSVQITGTAISVTVNGQTIPQGQAAIIQLATGKQVEVLWTSQNAIDIINEGVPGLCGALRKSLGKDPYLLTDR